MQHLPFERELTPASALDRVQDDLNELGLRWRLRMLGGAWPTVLAELFDGQGAKVSQGVGKGRTELALVGALFEALEHWCTDRSNGAAVSIESSHGFTGIELCRDEKAVELLSKAPEAPLACRQYTQIGGERPLSYPLFLAKPNYWRSPRVEGDAFDYGSLVRYGSNSGTAIGASFEEACIHALSEAVERDALSAFLARRIYQPSAGSRLAVVDTATLPRPAAELLATAEAEAGGRVHLLDLDRGFGVPVFLAVADGAAGGPARFGAGASLNAEYAAIRAVSELLQILHVGSEPEVAQERQAQMDRLAPYPRLLRCATFQVGQLIERDGAASVDFAAIPSRPAGGPLADWLADLTGRLARRGRSAFAANVHVTPLGTHVTSVVVPGFDRFFNVTLGSPVLPSSSALADLPAGGEWCRVA
ncbi:YcaO-like family protein [Arenibaculum sp.]|jgi:ribosomal protein S12 methylthiotransferase accessory factor|uniref:YcaO-like family protein n=1 Tax=Arenibaculum sp. TaxID=2865862 RepID=UPI002E1622F9|nr:YcaO-like family protein [Arenibaculum sp.]